MPSPCWQRKFRPFFFLSIFTIYLLTLLLDLRVLKLNRVINPSLDLNWPYCYFFLKISNIWRARNSRGLVTIRPLAALIPLSFIRSILGRVATAKRSNIWLTSRIQLSIVCIFYQYLDCSMFMFPCLC